ncbi:MAG: M14 family metallopeptidase, partial [Acidobacteriota bacterium]|nr:M14 family metallopeptidase [Acidobacteriota bacterium]
MFTNPISARRPFVTAALALAVSAAVPSAQAPGAPGYKTYDQLTASLRALAQSHGNLVKLVDLGKSHEGRSVWAVEVANPSTGAGAAPVDQRPALLVAANLEGDQLIGSELALYLARHLATSYATDAKVKALLDKHAVYILPRVNPDGAEQMFGSVKSFRRTNAGKFDADNDGRMDEDGPEDLNGDGFISVMRVKDPKGVYMAHPDDARLMKRADAQKGEAGGWSVYWEGIDNDADGFINEDGPGGVDLNRNFQHKYPYYTADAGPHMVSEPETRAVMNYMLKRNNVAAILTYGASDNLISPTTPQGALGAAQAIDLLAFADASLADARTVGTFTTNQGGQNFFGFGFGGRGGPPPQTRPPGQP